MAFERLTHRASPTTTDRQLHGFDVPGVGTIAYPFVVLGHTTGQKNVILVGAGL